MNTATPRILSGAEVRALSRRSNLRGAGQIVRHLAFIAVAGWLVSQAGPWLMLPALVLLGVAQTTLFAPLHETVHLTAFASRRANAVVGWLCACPALWNWHFFAVFHVAHHRFTQDPARDPELIQPPPSALHGYILRMTGFNYWRARLAVIAACWRGDLSDYRYIPAAARPRVIASVRWMSVFIVAMAVGAALLFGWRAPLLYWVLPQLLGQVFLRFYLLTEHTGCEEGPNGLRNTRTTLTNQAVRWLMWNMSFHAEHHLYPSIPFHRLPAAHRAVRGRLEVIQPGYARWHAGFFRRILTATGGGARATRLPWTR